MEREKLAGGTMDHAEIIIDYEKDKSAILNVPPATLMNRIKSAMLEWNKFLLWKCSVPVIGFIAIAANFSLFGKNDWVNYIVPSMLVYAGIIFFLGILHINRSFDFKMKKYFAIRTGTGKKNRIRVSEFKTNQFVLFGTENVIVDFDTSGDVKTQLKKIWIKEEHPSSIITQQCNLKEMCFLNNDPIWNVYFYFKNTPKDGELIINYI